MKVLAYQQKIKKSAHEGKFLLPEGVSFTEENNTCTYSTACIQSRTFIGARGEKIILGAGDARIDGSTLKNVVSLVTKVSDSLCSVKIVY